MPEGPEVRHNAEQLRSLILHRKLTAIELVSGKLYRNGLSSPFAPATVTEVQAYGKLIVVRFDNGAAFTSTLGMSGWWYPPKSKVLELYSANVAYQNGKLKLSSAIVDGALKHNRVRLKSDAEDLAIFTDARNFGNFEYHAVGFTNEQVKAKIGLDLLNELPLIANPAKRLLELKASASKRLQRMKMCELALEQGFIAGLGNIYRAEALWLTRLDPYRAFGTLSDDEWLKFCEVSMQVLRISYCTAGRMQYDARFIEACTGYDLSATPSTIGKHGTHRGYLVYGRTFDILGQPVEADGSMSRTLWVSKQNILETA